MLQTCCESLLIPRAVTRLARMEYGPNLPARWPLRRAQTPLRALGIEMSFGHEGRAGTRIIRLRASRTKPIRPTVSTVSTVGEGAN